MVERDAGLGGTGFGGAMGLDELGAELLVVAIFEIGFEATSHKNKKSALRS